MLFEEQKSRAYRGDISAFFGGLGVEDLNVYRL